MSDRQLVQRVIGVMAEHNYPETETQLPYPQSLRGMAVAVIAAVREHDLLALDDMEENDEAAHQEVEAEMATEAHE